jgi:hypothetical protein
MRSGSSSVELKGKAGWPTGGGAEAAGGEVLVFFDAAAGPGEHRAVGFVALAEAAVEDMAPALRSEGERSPIGQWHSIDKAQYD